MAAHTIVNIKELNVFKDSVDIIVTGDGGEFEQVVAASDAEGHSGAFVEPSADSASATDYSGIQVVSTFPVNTKAAKAEADGAKACKSDGKSSKTTTSSTQAATTTQACINIGQACTQGGTPCCDPQNVFCCVSGTNANRCGAEVPGYCNAT